jgi:hypothetical protein
MSDSAIPVSGLNAINGRVILKESNNLGIPNLLILLTSSFPTASPPVLAPQPPVPPTATTMESIDWRCSVITGSDGEFAVSYTDSDFKLVNPKDTRPDLHLSVLAPEEPGVTPQDLVLFSAVLPRQNAGRTEQYIIRLTTALLQKYEIPIPSEVSADIEPAQTVVGRLTALATRQNTLVDGAVGAARQLVESHRTRLSTFTAKFKPQLVSHLSRLASAPLNPNRVVGEGDSVFVKGDAVIKVSIHNTINSDDPTIRAPALSYISLTQDQVTQLKSQLDANGTVPGTAVAALNQKSSSVSFAQAIDRLPVCKAPTPSIDCTEALLNPPPAPPPNTPPSTPASDITKVTIDDVPRYLARLMEPMTAPEEELVIGLMPVATRDSVQKSVESFVFNPSPADMPSFHDFNNLQIAFDYVWQEAIDQGILDLAQNAYETIVNLGGNPDHTDYKNVHPITGLAQEGKLVLAANATPSIIVRDHRGELPGTRLSPPAANGSSLVSIISNAFNQSTGNPFPVAESGCSYNTNGNVRDHRYETTDPLTIADPVERLPALIDALNKKLLENYNFTIYAANTQERSVNFGILNTYRQIWTPLSYQAGPLVKSIPMAPRQSQKIVITHKLNKKRSQKEAENNLRVLKEDTSQTNRAEQEISSRADLKASYSMQNESGADVGAAKSTVTTKFSTDASKSSSDVKKSYHEAVFKSAQEFKQERSTEITTEETQDYETIETTEISNPNDEIAVTYLFYELQRRYRIYERLYRVQPVVLVAQEFPQPGEIDVTWLIRNDWILRRVILDDSFLPVLANLADTAGDETALEEMKINVNQQRCIVDSLRSELAIATQQTTALTGIVNQAVFQKSGASDSGLLGGIEGAIGDVVGAASSIVGDVAGAVGEVGSFLFGGSSDQNNANNQALQDREAAQADRIRDLSYRLEREVTALNDLMEAYTKALREHHNHLAEIARLEVHVKDNIMYYMQMIWMHEPADQRFFRLHNTPVPDLALTSHRMRVQFDHPLPTTMAPPHQSLPRYGGVVTQAYPVETVRKFDPQISYKPLSEVANIDALLGFKGNYAIFPLYQSNPLTDYMMDPYIDRATGQLVDPDDPLNWSLDEFTNYVCCAQQELSDEEFQELLPQLKTIYQAILSNPDRNEDVLVVPTNSLFIEALPAEHTLLEQYKLDHRMLDVKKAQAEAREVELENIRRTARIISGERGDPNIDRKILIEGGSNFVVPAGDQ